MLEISAAEMREGRLVLTLPAWQGMQIVKGFKAGAYDLVPHKEKRSKDANALCWALCNEIAEAIRSTKEDVYRDAIKQMPVYRDFHNMGETEAATLRAAWSRLGTGWITEQVDYEPDGEHVIIRAYYGSSTYNTKQMSRLIDLLMEDARAIGIVTPEEDKIRSLLRDWEKTHDGK